MAIARELRAEAERRGFGLEALVVEMWSLYRANTVTPPKRLRRTTNTSGGR